MPIKNRQFPNILINGTRLSVEEFKNTKNLTVNHSLSLRGLKNLDHLPEGLTVHGSLDLANSSELTYLAARLVVSEWLDLRGCRALTSLPKGLHVGGWLDISETPISGFPECLTVGQWIGMIECDTITSLAEDMYVGEKIYTKKSQKFDNAVSFGDFIGMWQRDEFVIFTDKGPMNTEGALSAFGDDIDLFKVILMQNTIGPGARLGLPPTSE